MLRQSLISALGRTGPLLGIAAVVTALFLLIPVLIIFPMSLTASPLLTWPPDLFSLHWFETLFESSVWTDAITNSIRIAVLVACLATVIGTLAGLGVAYATRWRRLLHTMFLAPIVLPVITYALGIYDVMARFDITGSTWPVVIGQTMLAAPLVFVVVSAGLAGRDRQLPHAAASLGAPPRVVLLRVELPLLKGSIAAGALLALAYSFDEAIVSLFLLPPAESTLPVQMLSATRESPDPTIGAASIVVIGVAASIGALILVVRVLLATRSPR